MTFNVITLFLIYVQLCLFINNSDGTFPGEHENCIRSKVNFSNPKISFFTRPPSVTKCWEIYADEYVFFNVKLNVSNCSMNCYSYSSACNQLYIGPLHGHPHYFCGHRTSSSTTYYADVLKLVFIATPFDCFDCERVGFELKYTTAKSHNDVFVRNYDFISSFRYPQTPPENSIMSWNVTSILPLQLVINHWSVSEWSTLSVYDGPGKNYKLLKSLNSSSTLENLQVLSSGPHMYIELHIGSKNKDQFLPQPKGFNGTVKAKGYCLRGTSPCGDGQNCYSSDKRCDKIFDCGAAGFDEKGCYAERCKPDEYYCSQEEHCYAQSERCNGKSFCHTSKHDETNCTSCSPGSFHCSRKQTCIYENWKCDGHNDCGDHEDEEDCTYTASRRVITAAIVGCLVCGLLLAIALGCSCKLYTLRSASHRRRRRNRFLQTTALGRIARELLQREAPPSYSMTVDGVEASSESVRRSSSSRRRRERRRRRRNREPRIRRAQPLASERRSAPPTETSNRDDRVQVDDSNSVDPRATNASTSTADTERTSPTPNELMNMTAYVLAEMGLTSFPVTSEAGPSAPSTSVADEENVASTSTNDNVPDAEQQAAPLPKKAKIRPVMVEAPFNTVMVGDIPACVYPNPPSYQEAISSGDPPPTVVVEENVRTNNKPQTSSSPKDFLTKLWPKHSSGKTKDFPKIFSFQNIFSAGQSSNSNFLNTANNDQSDDYRVRLVSPDANQSGVDNDLTSDEADDPVANMTFDNGSVAFELEAYNVASTSREASTNPLVNDGSSDDVSLLSLSDNTSSGQDSNLLDLTKQV